MTFRVAHKPPPTRHEARIASSSRPRAGRLTGSIGTSTTSHFAACQVTRCEVMRMSCCTFSAGGRVFIIPMRSPKSALTESTLLDYVRFQSGQERPLCGATINQRVAIADRALRIAFPGAPGQIAPGFQTTYWQRAPMGIGKPRLATGRLRVRTPKRTIVPLSVDEVARFWASFRNSRDLAIVGLMLLQGLRSQEVLDLNQDDLLLPEAQIRVRGKGNKTRFLPLAPEAAQLLDYYLRLERPLNCGVPLFVSLKGPARGARMTPAGLRSLFRYHRRTTGVNIANPHRFRHTFASDMVSAGVSLPALMQLMGHAQIQTTLIYVQVTPLEVYQQYAQAVSKHIRPIPGTLS